MLLFQKSVEDFAENVAALQNAVAEATHRGKVVKMLGAQSAIRQAGGVNLVKVSQLRCPRGGDEIVIDPVLKPFPPTRPLSLPEFLDGLDWSVSVVSDVVAPLVDMIAAEATRLGRDASIDMKRVACLNLSSALIEGGGRKMLDQLCEKFDPGSVALLDSVTGLVCNGTHFNVFTLELREHFHAIRVDSRVGDAARKVLQDNFESLEEMNEKQLAGSEEGLVQFSSLLDNLCNVRKTIARSGYHVTNGGCTHEGYIVVCVLNLSFVCSSL